MMRRGALVAALGLVLSPAAGCGSSESSEDARVAVYLSTPLSGPAASQGRAVAMGARDALAEARGEAGGVQVRVGVLDSGPGTRADPAAGDAPVRAAANARDAVEDSTAIAYIGELDSPSTRTSLPITNDARLLHVSPTADATYLTAPFEGSDEVPPKTQTTGARTFATLGGLGGGPAGHGREAMELVLAAIGEAEDPVDRASVVDALFALDERDSPLGPYVIDETGVAASVR